MSQMGMNLRGGDGGVLRCWFVWRCVVFKGTTFTESCTRWPHSRITWEHERTGTGRQPSPTCTESASCRAFSASLLWGLDFCRLLWFGACLATKAALGVAAVAVEAWLEALEASRTCCLWKNERKRVVWYEKRAAVRGRGGGDVYTVAIKPVKDYYNVPPTTVYTMI